MRIQSQVQKVFASIESEDLVVDLGIHEREKGYAPNRKHLSARGDQSEVLGLFSTPGAGIDEMVIILGFILIPSCLAIIYTELIFVSNHGNGDSPALPSTISIFTIATVFAVCLWPSGVPICTCGPNGSFDSL